MFERMREKRNEGGFTLIELLIVIIILAILAAIVVFAVGTSGQNAAVASCNADAKSVETAVQAFDAANGVYPGGTGYTALATWAADTSANTGAYTTNYDELTTELANPAGQSTGPWLRAAPGTAYYTILFDTAGQVWVNGPNTYTADSTTGTVTDFDLNPNACSAAMS